MSAIPTTMKAALFHGNKDVRVESRAVPSPGPGEVLLAIAIAGVCGSDVAEFRNGPNLVYVGEEANPLSGQEAPVVLGHEFGGYVVDKADDVDLSLGTLVACGAGIACGRCQQCRLGRTNLCESYYTAGLHRDGGLAEYVAVPASTCVDADAIGADAWMAGLAQPVSIAVHSFRRGEVTPGDRVAVLGAGGIGAFLAYAAVRAGAEVDVFDVDQERLKLAERLGTARQIDIKEIDREWADGAIYDCVYEVSGRADALETALAMAGRGGKLVLVGLQKTEVTLDPRRITLDEITVIGTSAHAVATDLPEALALLASREEGWADLAPSALPLSDLIAEGLARTSPGPVKVLFAPWSETAVEISEPLRLDGGRVVPA
jgi:(R,R)-butanediol dehydrogenase/meso-butanediol dehydrogenase/diacetyl reductase